LNSQGFLDCSFLKLKGDSVKIEDIELRIKSINKGDSDFKIDLIEPAVVERFTTKPVASIVFKKVFVTKGLFCVCRTKKGRTGYASIRAANVAAITAVPVKGKKDTFESLDEFKKMFDPKFISEETIKELWEKPSSQHGGRYLRSDFSSITGRALWTVNQFLERFISLDKMSGYYMGDDGPKNLRVYHQTYRASGRDITVNHREGQGYVTFSSEFMGCGNGSYYMLVGKNKKLHLEND
jgi:hypothetical protein